MDIYVAEYHVLRRVGGSELLSPYDKIGVL